MARQPWSTGCQHGVLRYSLATQCVQGCTKLQATRSTAGRRRSSSPRRQAPSTQRLAVKQEELDAGIDVNANYITQVDASNDVDAQKTIPTALSQAQEAAGVYSLPAHSRLGPQIQSERDPSERGPVHCSRIIG
ncbi:hypothetical protein ACQJBY_005318 [Aegilops geniculata]